MDLTNSGLKEEHIDDMIREGFGIGRVIKEHKERYEIRTGDSVIHAEITGNLRYSASERSDFPTVGDWVKFQSIDDDLGIIIEVLPRKTKIERKAVGKYGETQIIGSNIDVAFIVQSVGQDFNLNRMERYLVLCYSSGIEPIILINKIDLILEKELVDLLSAISSRTDHIKVIPISSVNSRGLQDLKGAIAPNYTYCFLGSSGVGKSTLINELLGLSSLKTQEVSSSHNKGKHTTTHRELIELPNGSIVIDTPGMREVGIVDNSDGVRDTFQQISELVDKCQFRDCTHTVEKGCGILEALESETISWAAYENYQKLKREQERFSQSKREKRASDKSLGKMYKAILKEKRDRKF
jgi:ribosome biogenesis GTPase